MTGRRDEELAEALRKRVEGVLSGNAARERLDPLLGQAFEILVERLGDSMVRIVNTGYWIGDPDVYQALRVDPPAAPGTNQSTSGLVYPVPVAPDPDPHLKIVAAVVVFKDYPVDEEDLLERVNELNCEMLRAHLCVRDYGNGLVIEAQTGLPAPDGQINPDDLISLLGETVGMADQLDDRLVEEFGVGRTER